jgi:hypothetical protein
VWLLFAQIESEQPTVVPSQDSILHFSTFDAVLQSVEVTYDMSSLLEVFRS